MELYLIDGHSYFYRAFHAIRNLSNSKGFPTNAIYGFTNMLFKLMREKKPDAIAVVLDSPVPTERHRIYEEYKAQRPETPDALVAQIPHMKKIIEAFRITFFEIPGVEADDVLGTLAKKASAQGVDVLIVSGDKDMMQVVGEGIRIYDPMKEITIDEAAVVEKFGVAPSRVAEVMALTGDAVDNIPGVKGIGEKTAKDLIKDFSSLDDLITHPERIRSDRVRKMITDSIDSIRLSERLATIDTGLPVEADMKQLAVKEPDWPSLLKMFSEFEFTSLIKMVPSSGHQQRAAYITVSDANALRNYLGLKE
ncbi:MAG TPA: 5'-3' exonuclease H3TH domain-containing protein [Dissulfurispiraceae bacterium]|nr:5'-3' exonuclease H3TH domain-containing protein [Dissulfurispiraceae bacterium]